MKTILSKVNFFFFLSIFIISCSDESDVQPITDEIDYVVDAESLMRNMTIQGSVLKDGDIPVPQGLQTDNITSIPSSIIVTSNSLFSIPISADVANGRKPKSIFIKLDGSSKYYQIDLDQDGNPVNSRNAFNDNRIRLNCSGMPDIRFQANPLQTSSYTNDAQVVVYSPPLQSSTTDFSNPQFWSIRRNISFKALDVGTGDVQVSLTWDSQSDVDLWLTEPNGNKIYYANSVSSTGGELDFDNTVAYGPENIFYKTVAPSGTYKVEVDYFSGAPTVTNYSVVVKNGSNVSIYQGTLTTDNQTNLVTTFTK